MNPYTTMTSARIRPRDVANAVGADPFIAAVSLAALERTRGWQAEAEMEWLLKQHGVRPGSAASRIALLRQTVGAVLVRAGESLTSVPQRGGSPGTAPVASVRGTIA
jgi:hypothetical protein